MGHKGSRANEGKRANGGMHAEAAVNLALAEGSRY